MSEPLRITHIIDTREPHWLAGLVGAELGQEFATLSLFIRWGDYLILPVNSGLVIAVERKEVNDLISSITSGRAKKQLAGCQATYDHTVLLVEGSLEDTSEGYLLANGRFRKFRGKSLRAWLRARRAQGVDIRYAPNAQASAYQLAHWAFEDWEERACASRGAQAAELESRNRASS